MTKTRCDWANQSDLTREYHDNEWGRKTHEERLLFEKLVLEMMQSGLSWRIILAKRAGMAAAFDNFEYTKNC